MNYYEEAKSWIRAINESEDWKTAIINNFTKALSGEHIQNNHLTYNNSGSKFTKKEDSLKEELRSFLEKITDFEDFKKKLKPSGPAMILTIETKENIGTDNSMTPEIRKEAEAFYKSKSGKVDDIFQKLQMGLKNGVPFKHGKYEFILEKRHGNPKTPFILAYGEGKETNILNVIYNGSTLSSAEDMKIWTIYPGEASLESPAYLMQDKIKPSTLSKIRQKVGMQPYLEDKLLFT